MGKVRLNLTSSFPQNTDISKRNLVYEGPLTWRVTKDKSVDVHVLLLDDILVLLQKQEERLVLKCHSRTITPTPDGKQMLSPIIKLNSAMTREVATDIKAFYVIFSWENGAQIYELVAQTVSERKNWCNIISDTAGSLKLPASNAKPRLSVTNRNSPHSPSYFPENLLGGAENGNPLKEALQSEDQEKDGLLEVTEFEERNAVGGAKMDKAVETFMADLQAFCRSQPPGQASIASAAQDRVLALKRLLQIPDEGEALFPAEPTDLSPENGDPQEGGEEWNGTFRIEGDNSRRLPAGSLNGPPDPEWSSEHLDKESPRFPIILSLQQSDGVKHHLKLLEDAIQGLKDIETEYWRLQQLMGKFTSSQQAGST
ncbi:PREDICTED: rho guanine nucleotide exchange factor 1 [Thamnophis sirtalis]|uniref:Rho guanine nucleotide exchange factor 1 n=1 Tax=Thamnophis sirtalis TaxID=35019 RepID=A0A6I9YRP2_9SAUR|nr:PREDICTED: rho guanine nucleotide exchange factor 1 [Thamnophis sirtalis]